MSSPADPSRRGGPPWPAMVALVVVGAVVIVAGVLADALWLALLGCVPLILAPWVLFVPAARRPRRDA